MELERLVAALTQRWWVLILAGMLGALFGVAADFTREDSFAATATIEIAPDRDVYGSETVLNRLVINEIATIGSTQLREQVVVNLGTDGLDVDPTEDMSVQQVPDTDLVNVTVSASTGAAALAAANEWASAYVDLIRGRERTPLQARLDEANATLAAARAERLSLDALLRESVVVRRTGTVSTYTETVLRSPEIWDRIVKLDQEIAIYVQQRSDAEVDLANVLDSSIAATAVGPLDPVRTGNGLGPFQGLLIGLSIAVAALATTTKDAMSHRAANQIAPSVWPTGLKLARHRFMLPYRKRRIERDVRAVGTQILTRLPDTRLQVVSFAGTGSASTQQLKAALSDEITSRGYSVSMMGDDNSTDESRTVEGMLDLLHASDSVIFADHDELKSKRFAGRIVTVVSIDEHRDREDLAARHIAESLEVSDSVLTVVTR